MTRRRWAVGVVGHDLQRGVAGRQGLLEAPVAAQQLAAPRLVARPATGCPAARSRIASSRSRSAAARCSGVWSSRSCCTAARPR